MKKIKSFTLAETIMTLFIVGLVVTASIPMFTRSKSTPNNSATFDRPWGYCDATRQMGLCATATLSTGDNAPVVIQNANGDIPIGGYDLTVRTGLNNYITPYEMFMSDERKLKIGDYIFKEDRTNLMITKNDEALEEAQKENIVIGNGNILDTNIQNSVIIGNTNGDNGGSIGSNSTVIGNGNQSTNTNTNITIIGTANNQTLANGGLLIGNNVQQNGSGIYIDDNNLSISNLIFGNTNTLTFNDNVSVHGGISAGQLTPSDERLKNIKGSYTKGLKEVLQVEPVIYRYKGQSGKHTGVIAQDLQKVFPEAVVKMPDGYLGVNTDPVFFAMLNAMKEVNQKTQEEEQKQIRLQNELDEIKAELETLTACKNDDFWSKIKCFWYDTKMFFKGLIA